MKRTEVAPIICWFVLAGLLFWRYLTVDLDADLIGLFIAWLGGVASLGVVWGMWSAYRRRLAAALLASPSIRADPEA